MSNVRPGWTHKVADESHPADVHYSGAVEFVCFTCREKVKFVGAEVAVTGGVASEPRDAPPGGLEADGS